MKAASVALRSSDSVRVQVIAAFASEGALADSIAGFVARASQADMAATVYDTIDSGGTLIAEAGTGTGKTFAYLVPALLAGGKVLLSTGTKPLQDQLFRKDLPAVLDALRINAATALLKGRANYVCLHRMERLAMSAGPPQAHRVPPRGAGAQRPGAYTWESEGLLPTRDDVGHLRSIVRFAATTSTGDRAELAAVPENAAVWPLVTSTRDNCLGAECPRFSECFVYKARRDAQQADVVVVNHHLFMADLAFRDDSIRDFLPTVNTVVLDEAHQLPSIAADFFGASLSLAQLLEAGRDARALGLARAPDGASWITLTGQYERAVRDLRLALGAVGLAIGTRTPLDRIERRADLRPAFDELDGVCAELTRALEINRGRDAELDLLLPRVADLRRGLAGWRGELEKPSSDGSEQAFEEEPAGDVMPSVRWISVSTHGAQFNETPLRPGQALARAREAQPQPWILTSATLTAAGRFDHFLTEVGIEDAITARWSSPFDFQKQALLYLPQSMPSPYDSHFAQSVAEAAWPLIRANGGRAFMLCTTLRAVDKVAERLRQLMALDDQALPLLVQGASTRRALIEAFRSEGNAVLVGSISFWEGIDIRGDALSLVVIDKLPFAPPDDPVVEAKIRYLRKTGRNPFSEYQLPEAIMLIKQGVGRLIRDENDRGVLMILDERLLTKPYGKTVLSSLPPFARTRSEAEAVEFLTRRASVELRT